MNGWDGVARRSIWQNLAWWDPQFLESLLDLGKLYPNGLVLNAFDVQRKPEVNARNVRTMR